MFGRGPQTLFSGSIRENLDPFSEHSDEKLWDALEKAQLKDAIERMPEALDTEVGDGGDLLSVGERQLLCLSRAVLRDSTILVMDECTASGSSRTQSSSVDASVSHLKCAVVAAVDVRTDAEIQTMIRQVFAGCTVFAIGAFPLSIVLCYALR